MESCRVKIDLVVRFSRSADRSDNGSFLRMRT